MSTFNTGDQMLEMFLFEMSSLLEQMDEVLLNSEKNQSLDADSVGEIFRIMHTIKGSSAMMDFNVISAVTHQLEDTFFYIRANGIRHELFTELFDLMLDATDFLKSQLECIQNGDDLADGNDDLVSRAKTLLAKLSGEETPAPKKAPKAAAAPEPPSLPEPTPPEAAAPAAPPSETGGGDADQTAALSPDGGTVYRVDVLFEEDCGMENLRAFMLVNTLKASCTILSMDPADIESDPDTAAYILVNGFGLILQTALSHEEIRELVDGVMHVKSSTISSLDAPPAGEEIPVGQAGSSEITGTRYEAFIRFDDDVGMENLRAFMLLNSIRSNCNIISHNPSDIEGDPDTASLIVENGFAVVLETPLSHVELLDLLEGSMNVSSVSLSDLGAGDTPAPKGEASAPAVEAPATASAPAADTGAAPKPAVAQKQPATHKPIKQNLINVSLSKLDELMDLMGELVITESMVIRSPDLRGLSKLDNFNKAARQLSKLTDELQDMVMSIRMVPVAGTFQKMQRIVRDMCRALGKEVDLVTVGDETDIDKTIIDAIADPIMHLVRNSMDHGVETPEERIAVGKPSTATVTLSAQNTGGEILVVVSDDGKGLDAERLLAKARDNGILTKPVGEYTEKEAFMLLCAPGFSTKEKVTEFSGRGVGMDVVKKNIEKIGGSVVIESKKGFGMSVYLKIPLTLAIVAGMDVSVGGGTYTLQITAINESFKAAREQIIVDTDGNEMIVIRGDVYPIIRLHELYNVPGAITNIEDGILIWVCSGDRSVCLFVDHLIGEQQIVVKPLPLYLNKFDIKPYGISGCTIQGDGNISLILDVGSIIEKVMEKR